MEDPHLADDPHALVTPHLPNLRDIGGWPTASGATLRKGVFFRSSALSDPAAATDPVVTDLGLRLVVDMRTPAERERGADHAPQGAEVVAVDILGSTSGGLADAASTLLSGSVDVAAFLAHLDAPAAMEHTYRQFVTESEARAGFATVLRAVLERGGAPSLVHCTAGKDRTGWVVALAMSAVGVPRDAVVEEYLAVRPAVHDLFAPLLQQVGAAGLDVARLAPVFDVDARYIGAAFDQAERDFGGVDGYLRDGLGLDDAEIASLGDILLGA